MVCSLVLDVPVPNLDFRVYRPDALYIWACTSECWSPPPLPAPTLLTVFKVFAGVQVRGWGQPVGLAGCRGWKLRLSRVVLNRAGHILVEIKVQRFCLGMARRMNWLAPAAEGMVGQVQPRAWAKGEYDSVCTSVRQQGDDHREAVLG